MPENAKLNLNSDHTQPRLRRWTVADDWQFKWRYTYACTGARLRKREMPEMLAVHQKASIEPYLLDAIESGERTEIVCECISCNHQYLIAFKKRTSEVKRENFLKLNGFANMFACSAS